MDNFLKQFKDNLENRPEPQFEENDWQILAQRLPIKQEKQPLSILMLWGLLPLFLLSLGANWFFYNKIKNTEDKMAVLNSRLEMGLLNTNSMAIQRDTIHKIRTVYERDTIYKTNILRETIVSYLPAISNDLNNKNNLLITPFNSTEKIINGELNNNSISINSMGKTINNELNTPFNSLSSINSSNDKQLITSDLEKLKMHPISLLKFKKQTNNELELNYVPTVLNKQKTLKQHLALLRPKHYSVGISAGLAYPFGTDLNQASGYFLGLNSEIFFSPNVSIWADAHYLQLTYKVDKMSDAIGVPVVSAPNNLFSFNGAVIKQPTIAYSAGIRYHFDNKKQWRPYLGVGFSAVTSLPYEVGYEFKNTTLGTVWDFDQTVNRRGTQFGFLLLDGGFERHLSKQYRWQIGANYRLNMSGNSVQAQRLLGIKSSILFDF